MANFRIYDGEANNVATKVFGGKSSGIRDWDNIKYPSMLDFNKALFAEYWNEDEVKLGKDVEEYREKLTPREREVYNIISGKLNWLDSIATDFNFVLGYLCTDSSVRSVISMIASFEQLHNRSYQYLTSTVLNQQEKEQAFEYTRRIPELVHRNEHVIKPIQEMVDAAKDYMLQMDSDGYKAYARDMFNLVQKFNKKEQTAESHTKFIQDIIDLTYKYSVQDRDIKISDELLLTILKGIVGNIVLEGLYFSGGFVYFHSLARDQKMIGSNNMISLIKTDENMHSTFYGMLIQIIMKEEPQLATKENYDYIMAYIKEAVAREKDWANYIFEGIDTLSIKEYHDYVEYLANLICRNAGLEEPYPENQELKSKWIATYGSKKRTGGEDEIVTRTDFLQGNAINYTHESGEDFDL
ncbi:ribonucleotide-diphosphate reductase subunit beta [Siminovitchia sp. 179-K 8D1 HS]|uniref:ribonucleotide-diphosphate reductase subunit beta n=1 Tax=Siminovitchia sp. 179-K 8D1 HS TaxID=3142385 RepID=UPI0039A2140A